MERRWLKYISFGSLVAITATLVAATVIEKAKGTSFAMENIYRSPLFIILWAILAASALSYIIRRKERLQLFVLHASLAVILSGGLLSLTTARRGELILAKGAPPSSMFATAEGKLTRFPFKMTFEGAETLYDKDNTPTDHIVRINVEYSEGDTETITASMNRPLKREGYTFCIKSHSAEAVSLLASHDPAGTPVTYAGYIMFALSFMMLFTENRSGFRHLLKQLRKEETEEYKTVTGISGWNIALAAILGIFICFRWYRTGLFPATNGAESLFVLACIMAVAGSRRGASHLSKPLFIAACTATCIAACNFEWEGDIQPILRTPLLGIHVSVIITAYALLGCMAINAIIALCVRDEEKRCRQALFGRLLLYPATMLLACGIFIGAVWANISWGRYWGWDPKEVWALITILLCSLAFHTRSIPLLASPRSFHIFCILLFSAMLFTYIGVNYFLGGMHAYI